MRSGVGLRPSHSTVMLLTGFVLLAIALRFSSFDDSLFGDELSTNFVVNGLGTEGVLATVGGPQEGTPPLFFMLAWLTKGIGDVEGLRAVSLLAGLAAIPLTYLLGLRTVGRPAALVAALLVALSTFQIYYGTEARAYSLSMVLCLLAALALLQAIEARRWQWWAAYAAAMAAAAYSHYTVVFVLLGLFIWAFFAHPECRRPLLLAGAGAFALYLPWLPEFLEDEGEPASHVIEILSPLTVEVAVRDIGRWSLGHPGLSVSEVPGTVGLALIFGGIAAGLCGLAVRLRSAKSWWPPPSTLTLVVVLAIAAPLGAVLHNTIGSSVFASRNLIASWPGLALLLGAVVTAGTGRWRALAVVLLVGGFSLGALRMLGDEYQRPDYLSAAEWIAETGEPGAPVVDLPLPTPGPQTSLEAAIAPEGQAGPEGREVIALTQPSLEARMDARLGEVPHQELVPELPVPSEREVAQRAVREAGTGSLFLVIPGDPSLSALRDFPGPVKEFLAALPATFTEAESRTFPGLVPVTVFRLRG